MAVTSNKIYYLQIAILEALIKLEDKLLGHKFIIVTDHKSLKYFETQPHLSS